MLVEVCANSLESAMNAEKAGADRIELCSELAVGGITPSYGLLKSVMERVSIPVNVLIRPRSGDFSFSEMEFGIMQRNIALCVELGVNAIVSGVLHTDLTLDIERTKTLIDLSGALEFTFHRAFDWIPDPFTALEQIEALGATTILTSGQQDSAIKGIDLLARLNKKSSLCTIMPGGGVNAENARKFKEKGMTAIHLTGTRFCPTLKEIPMVSMNSPAYLKDNGLFTTQLAVIENVIKEVK